MKKSIIWVILILVFVVVILAVLRFSLNGGEDTWIKDSRGVYVKHGNPSSTPDYVTAQQQAVNCAFTLYGNASASGIDFNSQCLGTCESYAVDIVHTPRTTEDDVPENQCSDYLNGKLNHFIELNSIGKCNTRCLTINIKNACFL